MKRGYDNYEPFFEIRSIKQSKYDWDAITSHYEHSQKVLASRVIFGQELLTKVLFDLDIAKSRIIKWESVEHYTNKKLVIRGIENTRIRAGIKSNC